MDRDCGTFAVTGAARDLWALLAESDLHAEFYFVMALADNPDIVSLNGQILMPGERTIQHVGRMRTASICGPNSECRVQVFAVEGA